jgi:hypothetical protein
MMYAEITLEFIKFIRVCKSLVLQSHLILSYADKCMTVS